MKNKIILLVAVTLGLTAFRFQQKNIQPIAIGTNLPKSDVNILDVMSAKEITLAGQKGTNGLLVMFSCNTCPFVIATQSRTIAAIQEAKKLNIGMVIVNSNEGQRDEDDSKDAMVKYGKDQKYSVPYLMDVNNDLADAFGATHTPECFLFDKDNKLVYHGSIDDSPRDESAVKNHYLDDAMTALSQGKDIATKNTVSLGCTIKRKK